MSEDFPNDPDAAATSTSFVELTNDERTWAMLAHLSGVVLAIIGPAVILGLQENLCKKDSAFVRFHAKQALIFQAVGTVATFVIALATCGFGAPIYLVVIIYSIINGLEANKGEWVNYPLMKNVH